MLRLFATGCALAFGLAAALAAEAPNAPDRAVDNLSPKAETVPPTADAAPASVRDDIAFQAALEEELAKAAPAPELRSQWVAIRALYRERFLQPLWRDGNAWTQAAGAVQARIGHAAEDALDLGVLGALALDASTPESAARQELALTAAAVAYARQASGARVDPTRISKLITAKPKLPDAGEILARLAGAREGAGEALAAYNPPSPAYRALRDELARLRNAVASAAMPRIPSGPPLKIGMRDERVKLLRARFGLEIAPLGEGDAVLYDTRVAAAVAGFQHANGLPASGILGPQTVAALSGGAKRRPEHVIIANMERWRWMPREFSDERIEVDIPNFSLALFRGGAVAHRARVIVGKPENPTPVFSNAMKFIVVNPSWHIPPGILKNEILPKLATDPGYLARLGYEMTTKNGEISIRQPPGEKNALGRIKFMFPNEHSVYLHDTPTRNLFASTRRAFSHGCVRLDDPFALAAIVLQGQWTPERIKSLVGKGERTLFLPKPIPIHLMYFTAFPADDGTVQFREDIYGYDAAMIRALALKD